MKQKITDFRPVITIDLPGKLQDFLIHEFGLDETGAIMLHKRNVVGKFIDSMWTVNDLPVKQEFANPCRIALPITPEMHYIVKCHFLFVSSWKAIQVVEFLESMFCLKMRENFITGYEKGFKQKQIIEAIIDNYNWKNNQVTFDMIKKMDYRIRRKSIKDVAFEIKNAAIN